jgi:hypothetical protein
MGGREGAVAVAAAGAVASRLIDLTDIAVHPASYRVGPHRAPPASGGTDACIVRHDAVRPQQDGHGVLWAVPGHGRLPADHWRREGAVSDSALRRAGGFATRGVSAGYTPATQETSKRRRRWGDEQGGRRPHGGQRVWAAVSERMRPTCGGWVESSGRPAQWDKSCLHARLQRRSMVTLNGRWGCGWRQCVSGRVLRREGAAPPPCLAQVGMRKRIRATDQSSRKSSRRGGGGRAGSERG